MPANSISAGCSHANATTRVYLYDIIEQMVGFHPSSEIRQYVDGTPQRVEGSAKSVEHNAVVGGLTYAEGPRDIKCASSAKTEVVTTDAKLANIIVGKHFLSRTGGPPSRPLTLEKTLAWPLLEASARQQ